MNIITNHLYNNTVELKFNPWKHQYVDSQGEVPSVTKILSVINKPALVPWAVKMTVTHIQAALQPGVAYDEIQIQTLCDDAKKAHNQKKVDAGNIGTFVHEWVEKYIKGEQPGMPVNGNLQEAISKFLFWVKQHNVEFLLSEQVIYSRKYRYTGTLDFICRIDGKLYLGDLKTSSGVYPEYLLQTAAYRYARTEEYPQETYAGQLVLHIGSKGDFAVYMMEDDDDYHRFITAFIAAHRLRETLEVIEVNDYKTTL